MNARRGAALVGLVALVGTPAAAGGCSREDPLVAQRAGLEALAWPASGEFDVTPTTAGRYGRLARHDTRSVTSTPARAVADELEKARAAGWRTVFAQCGGPWDEVTVHLVREVAGVGASTSLGARVVATFPADPGAWPQPQSGAELAVGTSTVMMAPQDQADPALVPPAVAAAAATPEVDVSGCLGSGAAGGTTGPLSIGTPAMLAAQGGPLPDDG